MREDRPRYPWRYFPKECDHDHLEYLPDQYSPKLITCKDCGAIRYMQINDTQTMGAVPDPERHHWKKP